MNRLPPLIELRAFEAAARHVSFKKAAVELGVTPTAISHQIRLLEQYCGRALFRRRPRPLSLTEAGARLFPVVRDGLDAFSVALGAIRRQSDRQPLRVTTTNAFASRWLVPRLPRWRKVRPDAPLDVIGTDGVLDLHAGDADVAIRYATGRREPKEDIAEEFLSDCFWPGAVARLVGIEGGVVSGVFNLESSGVGASDRRPRHDERYHEDRVRRSRRVRRLCTFSTTGLIRSKLACVIVFANSSMP